MLPFLGVDGVADVKRMRAQIQKFDVELERLLFLLDSTESMRQRDELAEEREKMSQKIEELKEHRSCVQDKYEQMVLRLFQSESVLPRLETVVAEDHNSPETGNDGVAPGDVDVCDACVRFNRCP
jgi:hypothetical protein